MKEFFSRRRKSFGYAFNGLGFALRTQENVWIHSIATVLVVALATWLKISGQDWAILLLVIGSVWTAELFNTALEAVVDLASPAVHPLARNAKDVGAAAVLVHAILSIIIGFLILWPPLSARI